jgi:hypothetical protein
MRLVTKRLNLIACLVSVDLAARCVKVAIGKDISWNAECRKDCSSHARPTLALYRQDRDTTTIKISAQLRCCSFEDDTVSLSFD